MKRPNLLKFLYSNYTKTDVIINDLFIIFLIFSFFNTMGSCSKDWTDILFLKKIQELQTRIQILETRK